MKAVAPHDRPREKLARLGAGVARRQRARRDRARAGQRAASALDLANALLDGGRRHRRARARATRRSRYGRRDRRARGRRRCSPPWSSDAGSCRAVAARRVQVTSPRAVAEFLMPQYGNRPVEQFGIVLLDTKHRVLRTTVLSVGTLDASIVHPREIFREATAGGAAAIVLFHNHPSGDPEPSRDDTRLTERLIAAGVVMGIDVAGSHHPGRHAVFQFSREGNALTVAKTAYFDCFSGASGDMMLGALLDLGLPLDELRRRWAVWRSSSAGSRPSASCAPGCPRRSSACSEPVHRAHGHQHRDRPQHDHQHDHGHAHGHDHHHHGHHDHGVDSAARLPSRPSPEPRVTTTTTA